MSGASTIGWRLFQDLQAELGDRWAAIPEDEKAAAKAMLFDLAALHLAALAGQDVELELRQVRAQLAVVSNEVREAAAAAFRSVVKDALELLGAGLAEFGKGFAVGLFA